MRLRNCVLLLVLGLSIRAESMELAVERQPALDESYMDNIVESLAIAHNFDVKALVYHKGIYSSLADLMGLLWDYTARINRATRSCENIALHCACWKSNEESAEFLLDMGCNVNIADPAGKTPLFHAVKNKNKKLVQLLLDRGADSNAHDGANNTVLHYICSMSFSIIRHELVPLLLKSGCNVNAIDSNGKTPLQLAASQGNLDLMYILLENGADVTIRDHNGNTVLHDPRCAYIANLLLDKGCELDVINSNGKTPLHLAAEQGNAYLIEFFLKRGADINARDQHDNTVLHNACYINNRNGITLLLNEDCDINAVNKLGETPLHMAAKFGNIEVVKLLVERGANLNSVDIFGKTPLYLIMTHSAIWRYLFSNYGKKFLLYTTPAVIAGLAIYHY